MIIRSSLTPSFKSLQRIAFLSYLWVMNSWVCTQDQNSQFPLLRSYFSSSEECSFCQLFSVDSSWIMNSYYCVSCICSFYIRWNKSFWWEEESCLLILWRYSYNECFSIRDCTCWLIHLIVWSDHMSHSAC